MSDHIPPHRAEDARSGAGHQAVEGAAGHSHQSHKIGGSPPPAGSAGLSPLPGHLVPAGCVRALAGATFSHALIFSSTAATALERVSAQTGRWASALARLAERISP